MAGDGAQAELARMAEALRVLKRANEELKRRLADMEKDREIEGLKAENKALKRDSDAGLTLKVSDKRGVSVYGLQKFPVTLYKSQWLKLLAAEADIRAFISRNDARLKQRPDEPEKPGVRPFRA